MSTAIAPAPSMAAAIERVLIQGDLSKLTPEQKVSYHNAVCQSVGLNPLTQPFEYITLSGKLRLYAKKDCTDQLRKLHDISVTIPARESIDGVYVVTARATMPGGRTDESTGAVPIENLKGDNKANAMMKAETKAKRRVTLSICGLGMLDESEVESVKGAVVEPVAEPVARVFKEARILKVEAKSHPDRPITWAEITFAVVNQDTGEEDQLTLPTASDTREAAVSLFQGIPINELVTLYTDIGPRNKKERICRIERPKALPASKLPPLEVPAGDDTGIF